MLETWAKSFWPVAAPTKAVAALETPRDSRNVQFETSDSNNPHGGYESRGPPNLNLEIGSP